MFFSLITYENQQPVGQDAADRLLGQIQDQFEEPGLVIIAGKNSEEGRVFVSQLDKQLTDGGWKVEAAIAGTPIDLGKALREADDKKLSVALLACEQSFADLPLVAKMNKSIPGLSQTKVVSPEELWLAQLLEELELLNVANQIAVIAIIAMGMTLVIITAGIDLSVGSLIAFSSHLLLGRSGMDGRARCHCPWNDCGVYARDWCMWSTGCVFRFDDCLLWGSFFCGKSGNDGGEWIGLYDFRRSFHLSDTGFLDWLGRGDSFLGIPNAVVLMILLYLAAHFLMSRTTAGRYVYAVGGNAEAARLSGVPVKKVLLWVYACSGVLAGLGGVVMASQFRSGDPKYGLMYELYVIAAVVVGGTSLSGGEGESLWYLDWGVYHCSDSQDGMNLTGVQSYTQKVVLGLVLWPLCSWIC